MNQLVKWNLPPPTAQAVIKLAAQKVSQLVNRELRKALATDV